MQLDTSTISAFLALAETRSSYAAARMLGLSQPALSRRIQRLEDDIGFELFYRAGRNLQLTAAGEQILPEVRSHFEGLHVVFNRTREEHTYGNANVRIGCLQSIAMRWLPEIIAAHPSSTSDLKLKILDLSATAIDNCVTQGEVDFAVNSLSRSSLFNQQQIGQDPLVLVVAANSPLADRPTVRWRDLKDFPLIAIGQASGNRQLINHAYEQINVRLSWRYEVQHIATSLTLAASGVAGTIVPLLSTDGQNEKIRIIPLLEPVIGRTIGIVYRRGERLSPTADTLRRAIAGALRSQLANRISQFPQA